MIRGVITGLSSLTLCNTSAAFRGPHDPTKNFFFFVYLKSETEHSVSGFEMFFDRDIKLYPFFSSPQIPGVIFYLKQR